MLIASLDIRRRASATVVLLVIAGCAQPVDAPSVARGDDAAAVADLQATAERIAAELAERREGNPPIVHSIDVPERHVGPTEWKRLEEAARPELPALIAEAEKLAAQR